MSATPLLRVSLADEVYDRLKQ
ncbi:MAG: hypothetical protein RL657_842, partial [Pseudomonadota bacterium]